MCIYMCVYIYIYIYIYIHTHTHINKHTHTYTDIPIYKTDASFSLSVVLTDTWWLKINSCIMTTSDEWMRPLHAHCLLYKLHSLQSLQVKLFWTRDWDRIMKRCFKEEAK